jgi:ADP-heptose:LPS heptosyltransferase
LLDSDASLKVVLVGSPSEVHVVAAVAEGLRGDGDRVIDLCGQTGIGELMAVINDATLTVASDSAPLHMAVGLGGRYIGLYGPTDPAVVGPWRGMDRVIAAPRSAGEVFDYRSKALGDSVMRRIDVDTVADRVMRAMACAS